MSDPPDIQSCLSLEEAVEMCVAELGWTPDYARFAIMLAIIEGELPVVWIDDRETRH
jgi:hypothetical protein